MLQGNLSTGVIIIELSIGLRSGLGFGLGLVACNYAFITVITCNVTRTL